MLCERALVVGCGYVGAALAEALTDRGWEVDRLRRTPEPGGLGIDVGKPFRLEKEYRLVFYLVAAGSYEPEAYELAYHVGVRHTLDALRESSSALRFLFISSTSVFAENTGGEVDEHSPVAQEPFSKASLLAGEGLVAASRFVSTTVRFSGIYGPGRTALIDRVRDGRASLKQGAHVSNRIHRDDCVGSLLHIAQLPDPAPLYVASDCAPTPYNEVLTWTAGELGAPVPPIEAMASRSVHMSSKRCVSRLLQESGYRFRYPSYREGVRALITSS